jgi:hypothetical protein
MQLNTLGITDSIKYKFDCCIPKAGTYIDYEYVAKLKYKDKLYILVKFDDSFDCITQINAFVIGIDEFMEHVKKFLNCHYWVETLAKLETIEVN